MRSTVHGKATRAVDGSITRADSGGFTAIASTGDIDRDGERILPGCFAPLPASIPIHQDHTMRAASVVARGRPYYSGDVLMVDAAFASTPDAQLVRQKVADGVIDSVSIVFRGLQWRDVDGVRTCTRGELLAADLVSVPSNAGARVLSVRGMGPPTVAAARREAVQALLAVARIELADARRVLKSTDRRGTYRRAIDDLLAEALASSPAPTNRRSL